MTISRNGTVTKLVTKVVTSKVVEAPPDESEMQSLLVKLAATTIIVDADTDKLASDFLQSIKTAIRRVDDEYDIAIGQVHKAHKAMLDLKAADTAIREKRRVWFSEQERIHLELQRQLEAEAEAEAKAVTETHRREETERLRECPTKNVQKLLVQLSQNKQI